MKITFKGTVKAGLVAGAIAAMMAVAPAAFADNSFEFHGYARGGVSMYPGFQDINGPNSIWGQPGGLNVNGDMGIMSGLVGRLGNEGNDNYAETEFVDKNVNSDGSFAKYHIMFATRFQDDFASYPNNSVTGLDFGNPSGSVGSGYYYYAGPNYPSGWNPGSVSLTTQFMVRQLYAEMGGFSWDPKSVYWIGKKYNGRDDIHILDLFWRDYSGTGFGVQNALNGMFDFSWVTNGQSDTGRTGWQSNAATSFLGINSSDIAAGLPMDWDFRFRPAVISGLSFLSGLELEYNFQYQQGLNDQTVSNTNTTNGSETRQAVEYGNALDVVYSPDKFFWFADGYSRFVVQINNGNAGTSWNMGAAYPRDNSSVLGGNPPHANAASWGFRAIAFGEANNILPNLDVMPALIYQVYNDGFASDPMAAMINFAIRPVYKFTQNLSLQVEYGIADVMADNGVTYWVDGGSGASGNGFSAGATHGMVQKFTVAPTLSLDSGFWGRPQLRLFYSFINVDKPLIYKNGWGDPATLGNDNNPNTDTANVFGVQFETWF
jgi:sucrose porin